MVINWNACFLELFWWCTLFVSVKIEGRCKEWVLPRLEWIGRRNQKTKGNGASTDVKDAKDRIIYVVFTHLTSTFSAPLWIVRHKMVLVIIFFVQTNVSGRISKSGDGVRVLCKLIMVKKKRNRMKRKKCAVEIINYKI